MKQILVLLVLISATHSNFAMQQGDKKGGSRRSATVEEIKKFKSAAEQRVAFQQRRASISEDVNRASKELVDGLTKEVRQHQDLNAQAAQERHEELRGLLLAMVQQFGVLEKRFDAVSMRLAGVETSVAKLIKSSESALIWPEVFNVNEAPAGKSRFPFANGGQWETEDTADETGGQNG